MIEHDLLSDMRNDGKDYAFIAGYEDGFEDGYDKGYEAGLKPVFREAKKANKMSDLKDADVIAIDNTVYKVLKFYNNSGKK